MEEVDNVYHMTWMTGPGHLPDQQVSVGGTVTLLATFCWEALDPDMYAEVKFNTTFSQLPKIVGDSIHPFMAEVFPYCSHLYEHDEARMV